MTIDPREIPMARMHALLLGSVIPRPIAFASTIDAEGNVNLSPFSFFNAFGSNPPVLIFSPARRVRAGARLFRSMLAAEIRLRWLPPRARSIAARCDGQSPDRNRW